MSRLFEDEAAAKITALCPWFGGKRTLAPRIIEALGRHSSYWEPFCGGMSVLLQKPESSHETVNDLHADLINLARVIGDEPRAVSLYQRLSMVLCDEERRAESVEALRVVDDPVDRAFHYFIVNWFGRNGFSGTTGQERASFAVRWTPNGGHGGQRFASAVDSIPAWHQRLRRVTILHRDAFDVIESIEDHPRVAIYVDPPYVVKKAKYEHDFGAVDHERLAVALRRFVNARVVVSYYDCPTVRALYDGWRFVDCTMRKGLHNAGRRGQEAKAAPEVLILNTPSIAEGA